jgi:hypothetical protein
MISVYTSAFNLVKNSFNYQVTLDNFLSLADEVVVAVNTSEDDTLAQLKDFAVMHGALKVIETAFKYDDISFDGAIKNAALQATTHPVRIQMDLDETFVPSHKPRWRKYAQKLLDSKVDCYLIPTIDLWGDCDHIRADKDTGYKFRMHKGGLKRGIWYKARVGDYINTRMSDTGELLTMMDDLVENVESIVPSHYFHPLMVFMLNNYVFTVHHGFESFEQRVNVNKAIWKKAWEQRSGHQEDVALSVEELKRFPVIKHNLVLE